MTNELETTIATLRDSLQSERKRREDMEKEIARFYVGHVRVSNEDYNTLCRAAEGGESGGAATILDLSRAIKQGNERWTDAEKRAEAAEAKLARAVEHSTEMESRQWAAEQCATEAESSAAAMRTAVLALDQLACDLEPPEYDERWRKAQDLASAALSTSAGRELLERLRKAEARCDLLKSAIDAAQASERACSASKAEADSLRVRVADLIEQVEIGDYEDSEGHSLGRNIAYVNLRAALSPTTEGVTK